MRILLLALLIAPLAFAAVGCTQTIDGSSKFSEQMPQYNYNNDDNPLPSYMHPGDSDSNSP